MNDLTLIKNNNLENEIEELKEELLFIDLILNHFELNDDEYIITKDGMISRKDSLHHRFSNYNIALIRQKIKKLENDNRKQSFKIINREKNHLKLI